MVTQAQLDVAFARSGLLQAEDPNDPGLAPWIAGHGFVRIDGAALPADQQTRDQLGAQLLQPGYPWSQFDDLGPAIPLRSYRAGDAPSLLREPGNRSLLLPPTLGERVFAWTMQPANQTDTELESTIASGSSSDAVGCLRRRWLGPGQRHLVHDLPRKGLRAAHLHRARRPELRDGDRAQHPMREWLLQHRGSPERTVTSEPSYAAPSPTPALLVTP